jgi:hypothetical protein
MTATNSTEPAKDGNGNAFNITFAAESVSGNKAQKTYIGEPVGETIITPAQDGTDGTGITAPTGAVAIRGWLSGIYSKLAGSISVTGTFWQATQPISAASLPLPSGAATRRQCFWEHFPACSSIRRGRDWLNIDGDIGHGDSCLCAEYHYWASSVIFCHCYDRRRRDYSSHPRDNERNVWLGRGESFDQFVECGANLQGFRRWPILYCYRRRRMAWNLSGHFNSIWRWSGRRGRDHKRKSGGV